MLVQLVIQDFALIENVELMFGCGLNVLTGETGAGKSIIVDAMNLLVGGRIQQHGTLRCRESPGTGLF